MSSAPIEPPDMGILRDKSQLEFYIDAVERWSSLAVHMGTPLEIQAELILTIAFKQNPELCKELSDHFGSQLRNNKQGIAKLVEWLKSKYGLNKHADMVKVFNNFLNTCRKKSENLVDFITRFERNYNEVKKMGETLSETCLSLFLLRQAQLTDTDSQIITISLEFDPKSPSAKENFNKTKAAMKKFQHTQAANQAITGHSHSHSQKTTGAYLANLQEEEELDPDQIEAVKTLVTSFRGGRGGRGGLRGGRGGRGGDPGTKKKIWKCEFCMCRHPKWKDCGCPCTTHRRENCPNPVQELKEEYFKEREKRKAENTSQSDPKRRAGGTDGSQGAADRGYITFAKNYSSTIASKETDYEATLIAKDVRETESQEYQPLSKLFQVLGMDQFVTLPARSQPPPPTPVAQPYGAQDEQTLPGATGDHLQVRSQQFDQTSTNPNSFHEIPVDVPSEVVTASSKEQIFLRNKRGENWKQTAPINPVTHKLKLLVDCGSPSTIVGVEDYQDLKTQYPQMIQATFEYEKSNKHYEFGGGEKTYSMGKVRLPIYVVDSDQKPHLLHVWVEILNQPRLPLLFGGRSLVRCGGTLCFKTFTLQLDWQGSRLKLPIEQSDSGHFLLQFFPMSNGENSYLTREMVNRADWTDYEIENIVSYLAAEKNPDIAKLTNPEEIKTRKQRKPLNKQQINRLHQALGHAHRNKIKQMVKSAGVYDDKTLKYIEDLADCEVCAVEHNRIPRPKISAPRSTNFNHILAVDLKENKRFKNAPPYIMYFIDTFTRFKAGVFIKNKQASTIAEHLVTEWIQYHGPPKYLMTDRGNEFHNGEVKELCQFHGIRFTSTASYSPHQNAYVERGHAVADRALERMLTADPALKPEVALGWVIHAVNSLQNVDGLAPFQLVFGRLPKHPSLVEDNPGANQEIADSQATWARHYRMQMAAREAFTASESDRTIRKALEQRVYTDPGRVQRGDWIYFKRNHERYWKGPAKVVIKDGKNLHCVFHGQPVVVNSDDVLLNKPETEEVTMDQFVTLPARSQPPPPTPVAQPYGAQDEQTLPGATGDHLQVRSQQFDQTSTNPNSFHEIPVDVPSEVQLPGEGQGRGNQDDPAEEDMKLQGQEQSGQLNNERPSDQPQPVTQSGPSQPATQYIPATEEEGNPTPENEGPAVQVHQSEAQREREGVEDQQIPATSTNSVTDLGTPLQCNLCDKETSSMNFQAHCVTTHNIPHPSVRQHAKVITARPDSIYENVNNLKPGVVVVDDAGNYMTLVRPTSTGWTVRNVSSKQESDVELVKEMVDMRYVGFLEEETADGVFVTNLNNEKTFVRHGDYNSKVFFTSFAEYEEEKTYVINIPRSRHGEPDCVAAKQKELRDFKNYDVYEIVEKPNNKNIIGTEWVLVEKDKPDGSKVTKARLCLRGDQEAGIHQIPRESPTVNKISVKILVTLAVSQGWDIRSCDVERAFLQTENITREVFVKPPAEMNLPRNKVLQLKRTAYGLVDASRSFFLKQAREFKEAGFYPLSMDPALFVHRPDNNPNEMCDAAAAVHVDDALNVGQPEVLDKTQETMRGKLTYGSVETLPFRFLGSNYSKDNTGDIILDQQHYVASLEEPDMKELSKMVKQDVLPDQWQSTFRSLASKVNVLASTVRPDFTYAAKYLTTRYNKATKSDMTSVVKLIRRAKEDTTEIVIPNIGQPEEWILVGVVDASHRTSGNLFAVGGHVVLLLNKHTKAAAVLHWSSKKIERVVHSSTAAETLSMQKMFSTIFLVRKILTEMCGNRVRDLNCVALTDNQPLFSNLHHIKANSEDYRLQADIIELRQSIEQEKTVQEVRYVHTSQNIADCLTKTTKSGHMLLQVVRTGQYDLPGGTVVRDSTLTSVRTWNQLMRAEHQDPDLAESMQNQDKSEQWQQKSSVSNKSSASPWSPSQPSPPEPSSGTEISKKQNPPQTRPSRGRSEKTFFVTHGNFRPRVGGISHIQTGQRDQNVFIGQLSRCQQAIGPDKTKPGHHRLSYRSSSSVSNGRVDVPQ